MNAHIVELTADGPIPEEVKVEELDQIFFKNTMDQDTTVTVKKGLLKPKGDIEVAAKTSSERRTVKKHQSGAFSFTYTYTAPGTMTVATRSGTIRI